MTCLHELIKFANMQLAYRHDERPGESYKALDGKKMENLHGLRPAPSDHDNFCLPRNMAFVVIERTSCHPT